MAYYDDFSPDANPLTGWTIVTDCFALKAISDKCAIIANGFNSAEYYSSGTFSDDQYSQVVISVRASYFGVIIRCSTSAATFYLYQSGNSATVQEVHKCISGSFTQLGSSYAGTASNGDTIKLAITGTTLTPYINGTAQATRSDSSISTGYPGLRLAGDDTIRVDDWEGGNVGGTAYSLSCAGGTYAVTGTAVSTLKKSKLGIGAGSYSLTGTAVSLLSKKKIPIEGGTYSLTGTAVSLLKKSKLTLDSGTYALTGIVASLLKKSKLTLDAGIYSLTGTAVSLLSRKKISIEAGTYTLTGTNVTLTKTTAGAYILAIGSGSYNLTGTAVSLLSKKKLPIGSGVYTLTGTDISLKKNSKITLTAGSYLLTGSSVTLTYVPGLNAYVLTCGSGTYTLTGKDVTLIWSGATVVYGEVILLQSSLGRVIVLDSSLERQVDLNTTLDMEVI